MDYCLLFIFHGRVSFFNSYVERNHRTYGQKCLQVHRLSALQEVREVTEAFLQHYKEERLLQSRTFGKVPPRVAFLTLPTLPTLPERVDPNVWLTPLDQKMYLHDVGCDGWSLSIWRPTT